jgi:Nif-specific regulatory protein
VLVEEAYALALAGRCADALALLDRTLAALVETAAADGADAVRLARARILAARAQGGDGEASREALELLLAGPASWRARLELARAAQHEGRADDALLLLRETLGSFHASSAEIGSAEAEALGSVLSAEVGRVREHLEARGGPVTGKPRQPTASLPDPNALLRLVELGRRIAGETEPERVLGTLLREAIGLVGADRGFVVLARGEDIEVVASENLDTDEVVEAAFEVSRSLVRDVVRRGASRLFAVEDLSQGDPAGRSLAGIGARAVACVPIAEAGEVLGALYLDRHDETLSFAPHSRQLLELFAGQAAVALGNAREHRKKVLALETAEERLRRHRTESELRRGYHHMVGASDAMQEVYRRLQKIEPTEMPVIILGETGTGKELVARSIHDRGPRRDAELVAVNCAGLAESLLESELFGHERGAFTGADRTRPGLFEVANGGTLFLDEVGEMSPRMQADLLRVLESGEIRRVGGRDTIRVDVRIIAATHRDLRELVDAGEFREDLYYRLNVLSVNLPPLRQRAGDVPLLVTTLLSDLVDDGEPPKIGAGAMRWLEAYGWPGNVRELENVLRRLVVLGEAAIDEKHLPPEIVQSKRSPDRVGTLREAEDRAIHRAMRTAGGNKAEAARVLGIDRNTLYAKLKRLEES